MATVAKLNVQIGAELSGLQKSLKTASASLESFGKKASEIGKTMSTRLTLPIVGGFGFAVKAASDAEETFSKFATVFRDVGSEAEASFKTLRNEYGLSATASKALLSSTGDLLTGFGFAQSESLRLSTEVQKLAVDLASFTNFAGGAQGASDALTKALLGERESVKALGISILEEDVKKQMAINTSKGLTFATERQAKAQATLDIAMAQSQNAIGDYERTSGSFANQFRLLQANISDLATEFGTILLPVAQRLLAFTKRLVDGFKGLDSEAKKQILLFAGIAAAIGPVLIGLGAMAKGLVAVKALLLFTYANPYVLVTAGVVALAGYYATLFNEAKKYRKLLDEPLNIDASIDQQITQQSDKLRELVSRLDELNKTGPRVSMGIVDQAGFEANINSLKERIDKEREIINKLIAQKKAIGDTNTELIKQVDLVKEIANTTRPSIEAVDMATEGKLEVRTVDVETYANSVAYLGSKLKQVAVDTTKVNWVTDEMSSGFKVLKPIADNFASSFASGLANVVMQTEKLRDALKNIGKLLLSSAIQFAISALLTGGVGTGTGFFGSGKGLLGSIFKMNDGMVTSKGDIVKFHPDDNILAMKDFSGLGGGGGSVSAIRVSVDTIRVSGSDILIALKNTERAYG
jgi:hypothetical protein